MTYRRVSAFLVLLGTASLALPAQGQTSSSDAVQIDGAALQDLKGYEPPPMFGAKKGFQSRTVPTPPLVAAVPAPAPAPILSALPAQPPAALPAVKPETPPAAKIAAVTSPAEVMKLPTPKKPSHVITTVITPSSAPEPKKIATESILNFPAHDNSIVTRQNMKAPEDTVLSATPDYSDSHTLLKPTAPAGLTAPAIKASAPVKKHKSAALPEATLVSASTGVSETGSVPMRYVPKSKPSMPAVKSGTVEKNQLDAFALPSSATSPATAAQEKPPTPGERAIDQALNTHMVPADKKTVELAMSGVVPPQSVPIAATPVSVTAPAKVPVMSMEYKPQLTDLQQDQQSTLKSEIIPQLRNNPADRLEIKAYADAKSSDSDARRISLSRALAVRAYLLDNGIEASRIDVRALGSNTTEKPLDRIDFAYIKS